MRANGRSTSLLGLAGLGFVSLGLPDGLLGVAWPSVRAGVGLAQDALGALLVATTTGYVLSSFASGPLLTRIGLGGLLALSCLATAGSLLGYSVAPGWWLVILLGVLAGLGAGAIDAGINHYVASHHSARALNLLHAGYGLGTTTGPVLMTGVLMAGAPWQCGYAIVGASQLALALAFASVRRLWPEAPAPHGGEGAGAPLARTLRLPAAWLGAATFALYTGLEAAAGAWTYTLLTEARGLSMQSAGSAVSLYWGALMAGRITFALSLGVARIGVLIGACMAGLASGAFLLALDLGATASLLGLALFGLAAGPIFPSLISTTPRRFGSDHAGNVVGLQIAAAAIGQSLLPAALGRGVTTVGLEVIPWVLVLCAALLLVISRSILSVRSDREPDGRAAQAGDPGCGVSSAAGTRPGS